MATRKRKSKMGRPRIVQNPRRLAVDFERGDVEALEEAEDLPYVFDRFWRGDPSRSHKEGSLGLGLAIAQQLVEAHGGRILVESDWGQGATFTMELPADVA